MIDLETILKNLIEPLLKDLEAVKKEPDPDWKKQAFWRDYIDYSSDDYYSKRLTPTQKQEIAGLQEMVSEAKTKGKKKIQVDIDTVIEKFYWQCIDRIVERWCLENNLICEVSPFGLTISW